MLSFTLGVIGMSLILSAQLRVWMGDPITAYDHETLVAMFLLGAAVYWIRTVLLLRRCPLSFRMFHVNQLLTYVGLALGLILVISDSYYKNLNTVTGIILILISGINLLPSKTAQQRVLSHEYRDSNH